MNKSLSGQLTCFEPHQVAISFASATVSAMTSHRRKTQALRSAVASACRNTTVSSGWKAITKSSPSRRMATFLRSGRLGLNRADNGAPASNCLLHDDIGGIVQYGEESHDQRDKKTKGHFYIPRVVAIKRCVGCDHRPLPRRPDYSSLNIPALSLCLSGLVLRELHLFTAVSVRQHRADLVDRHFGSRHRLKLRREITDSAQVLTLS
jgi:hypothetical protein